MGNGDGDGHGHGHGHGHGGAAEDAARHVAAVLGLPDFVFTVPRLGKGRATREVGDALLIANGLGAVVQVKARRPDAADDGVRWLSKHGAKAMRQAEGTRRSIRLAQEAGEPLIALPLRASGLGAAVEAACGLRLNMEAGGWPSVIVVNHPTADGWEPPDDGSFWTTLGDWRELWAGLRSVTSTLTYVHRVLTAGLRVPLGQESVRFRAVRDADVRDHGDAAWLTEATYEDPVGAQLYRELIDRVWPDDRSLPAVPIADYRLVVEFLDSAAPGVLPRVGRWILNKRAEERAAGRAGGLLLLDRQRVLVYKAARWYGPESNGRFDAELVLAALVRSAEASEQTGRFVPALAVGHLVRDGGVDYRYALTKAPAAPTALERAVVVHDGGALDLSAGRLVPVSEGPPDGDCPCGSGASAGACPAVPSRASDA